MQARDFGLQPRSLVLEASHFLPQLGFAASRPGKLSLGLGCLPVDLSA
jgi:hypothetical protein